MKHNLLEIFDEEVKPVLFKELKRENPSIDKVIYQHLTIIHASILGGLIEKSKKPNGAKAIKNLLEKGNHTGEIIERIPAIFGDEQKLSNIKKLGNSLLTFVFDDGADKAFEKIQHFLSEKYLTTEEELIDVNRMIAPFSMGLIGRIVHDEEMSEQQVAEFLAENEPVISMRFPGLAQVLGIKTNTAALSSSDSPTPTVSPSEADISDAIKGEKKEASAEEEKTETKDQKLFLNALYPWVVLLVISGLSLFLLKKYENKTVQTKVKQDNPFNFIQRDSLILGNKKSYTLPGNTILEVDRNSTLDSVLRQLEIKQGLIDTLRFINPDIRFQDSTAVLTTSANKELANILSILQSYTDLKMNITLFYDKSYPAKYPDIANHQIKNLRDYFTVFGLDESRFKINKSPYRVTPLQNDTDTLNIDTMVNIHPPQVVQREKVELLFYRLQPTASDSLNIENN